ncbi:acyl-CoA N-acyltransferase [Hypoxylon fuscum]|nr:acyl-CoA N-acyltransferase [Hypoxylon fuscum]
MSFELRKASLSDIPAIVDAFYDAFAEHPLTRRVLGSRWSASGQAYWKTSLSDEIQDPNAHYLVIAESTSTEGPERVLAFGKWRQPLTPTSPPPPTAPSWPEGADLALAEEFLGTVAKKHEEITKDRPHWYLEILGVRKEFQGRGLGKQLLRWGLTRADEAGVEAFLAASPAGVPLYAKNGFDLIEAILLSDEKRVESFMLRQPQKPQIQS